LMRVWPGLQQEQPYFSYWLVLHKVFGVYERRVNEI
jgi:hypothetical protein